MRKILTKIISCSAAAAVAAGLLFASACSNYKVKPLTGNIFTQDRAESNGGFAVGKGDFVYFINGQEANTADNTFGTPVKGAIMRISKKDLADRNYANADTVVPHIAYSGNTNAGIFVYGDYVYYSTPSTEKNSDGEVQNSNLAFKRTKLDGTDTMKDYFVQYPDSTVEYRFVEEGGVVYLVYVATSENLYGTSCTNIHSVNTRTGDNTLLAYNVDSVVFDESNVENPRIYYTMKVTDFVLGSTSSNYNQIWTVNASATTPNAYDFTGVADYDAETNPMYVNCGKLVFDGIGKIDGMMENVTQFNSPEAASIDRSAYTYSISKYSNGTLFYTRTSTHNSTAMLFSASESELLSSEWKAAVGNPKDEKCLLRDASSAANFNYLFEDGKLSKVLISSENGIIKADVSSEGKIIDKPDNVNTFYVTTGGQATILFTREHGGANYIYYSLSGGNGYTVYRISYDGGYAEYSRLPVEDEVNECTPVRILDLDSSSDWYKAEMFDGQLLFASETKHMTEYGYIMVCDLRQRNTDGTATSEVMTNERIDALNEQFSGVSEKIDEVDEEVYEGLKNLLNYAFFTDDGEYLGTLIKAYKDILDYDEEHFWSKQTVEKFNDFIAAKNDWADYGKDVAESVKLIKVNGKDVTANKRDYYYSLLGRMNEADAKAYSDSLKTTYLQAYPEAEQTWFEGLSTGAKVGFIIGVCAGGLIVIAAAVVIPLVIIKKRNGKLPEYSKKRIKVDTTDDKNINVYED